MENSTKGFNWVSGIFLISYQTILLLSLPFYFYYATPKLGTLLSSFVLLWLTGLSITAGYHRYFSHRAYKAHPIFETILIFFGTMAVQSSVLRWSFEHRLHHAFVDTDKDPYSIQKGFWYAHFAWMMEKPEPIDNKVVSDLLANKLIVFQHRYYALLMVAVNALVFFSVGFVFQDYLGAFVLAVWTRIFCLHHFTWFINSLAHTWGSKQFSQEQSAVDNYIISLLTFGEGYHNYHHTFANDYRNGIRWFHFDPTKWLIWGASKLGLTYNLKRVENATIKRKMVIEHKNYLIQSVAQYWSDKKQELESQVVELSERILQTLNEFSKASEEYKQSAESCSQHLKDRLKMLQQQLSDEWQEWKTLSRIILKTPKRA